MKDSVTIDLSSLDEPVRDQLRKQLNVFSANLNPRLAMMVSAELGESINQLAAESNVVSIDISSLDTPTRDVLRAQLNAFSANLNPRLATMVSAELGESINQLAAESNVVSIDISSLDKPIRDGLRAQLNAFSANLNPRLAMMVSAELGESINQVKRES